MSQGPEEKNARRPRIGDDVAQAFIEQVLWDSDAGTDAPPGSRRRPKVLQPGTVVGDYTIDRVLGEGGMGIVYLADEHKLQRKVVLKTVKPRRGADPDSAYTRLLNEARAASRLDHPSLCPVLTVVDRDEDGLFIVLPYIPGKTLCECLDSPEPLFRPASTATTVAEANIIDSTPKRRDTDSPNGRFDVVPDSKDERRRIGRVVSVLETVATAVNAAHKVGIVHRDLKPGNIMIRPGGVPVVLDFGLASAHDGSSVGADDTHVGTPAYMAPEQVRGESVDVRTDIYALGVTLYEMVAGVRPFLAPTNDELFASIERGRPRPLLDVNAAVSRDLNAVCRRAMSIAPAARFESAAELADELGRVRRGDPTRSRPIGRLARLGRHIKRFRKTAVLAVLTITLAIGLAVMLDIRNKVGDNSALGKFVSAFDQIVTKAKAEKRIGFTGAENTRLLRLAEDHPLALRLISDPTDEKTLRRIRRELENGPRSDGTKYEFTHLLRPQWRVDTTRPQFVFCLTDVRVRSLLALGKEDPITRVHVASALNSCTLELQRARGRSIIGDPIQHPLRDVRLSPERITDANFSRSPPNQTELTSSKKGEVWRIRIDLAPNMVFERKDQYEWTVTRRSETDRHQPLTARVLFEIAKAGVHQGVIDSVNGKARANSALQRCLNAMALADAGFYADAHEILSGPSSAVARMGISPLALYELRSPALDAREVLQAAIVSFRLGDPSIFSRLSIRSEQSLERKH